MVAPIKSAKSLATTHKNLKLAIKSIMDSNTSTCLLNCPNEIIEEIINNEQLTSSDLSALSRTCVRLEEIISSMAARWKKKFDEKFVAFFGSHFENEGGGEKGYTPWREHFKLRTELEQVLKRRKKQNEELNTSH